MTQAQHIVERQALVAEHDVVGARHGDQKVDAGRAQQHGQRIHVVLVGLGVIGVTHVHAHRQAQQLAAAVILQTGANDLLGVIEIFRPDEADHGVDQQRAKLTRHGVGPHFQGLLVDTVVRVGRQCAALAGFEVHDIVTDRAARQRACRVQAFTQQREVDTETAIGLFAAGDGLKRQVQRRAALDRLYRGAEVREHAGLHRDVEALPQRVQHLQQADTFRRIVGRRIDPDHRIAHAEQQAVERRGGDAHRIVRRMIGLQSRTETAGQTERGAHAGDDATLRAHRDQILIAHQLGHRRHHFRRQARRQGHQRLAVRGVGQQPVAEFADRHRRHRRECGGVMPVHDQPRDLVVLVGDQGFMQKRAQGQIGQNAPCRHTLRLAIRSDAGQFIAGTAWRGAGHHRRQRGEVISAMAEACVVLRHARSLPASARTPHHHNGKPFAGAGV